MSVLKSGLLVILGLFWVGISTANAATFVINNNDGANEGFNDNTAVAPVGGNSGTTLGEQRMNAFQFAADQWGAALQSGQTIFIDASFDPDTCSPAGATLGFAGPSTIHSNFTNAPLPDTFYAQALANALAGSDQDGSADIVSSFNSSLDNDCIGNGTTWYYGLDGNPSGNQLDFVSTAAHEIAHGLGFASFSSPVNGVCPNGSVASGGGDPGIYEVFVKDLAQNQTWAEMGCTLAGNNLRVVSAQNTGNVVWDGPGTTGSGVPALTMGTANDPNDGNTAKVLLYAPAPVEPGSSISHWDTSVTPEAMMEPFENGYDVVQRGLGLATCLMQDIGWTLLGGTQCPDGAATTPLLDLNPGGFDFGEVSPGSTDSQTFTVSNVGTGNLNIANVTVTGSDFSISGDSCTGNSVPAGGPDCMFDVVYTPATTARRNETLTVTSNAPSSPDQVTVSGGAQSSGGGGGGGSNSGGGGSGSSASGLFFPLLALITAWIRLRRKTGVLR